jgi:hypothetical protein
VQELVRLLDDVSPAELETLGSAAAIMDRIL